MPSSLVSRPGQSEHLAYPVLGEQKLLRLLPLLDRAQFRINVESSEAAIQASEGVANRL